jgi:hypothetical protein
MRSEPETLQARRVLASARSGHTRARWAVVPIALSAALLAGCSGTSAGSSSSSAKLAHSAAAPAADSAGGSSFEGSAAASPGKAQFDSAAALLADRRLVLNASLEVTVKDATLSAARVRALALAAGGYIASEETTATPPGDLPTPQPEPMDDSAIGSGKTGGDTKPVRTPGATSLLSLRVPSDRLATLTDQVASLGTVAQRSQSSQDVTQQTVDVASRLATQKASIARIRALLSRATRIGDIVSIEGELSQREANLESMQAQLKSLDDSVALATLNVTLTPKGAAAPPAKDRTGFLGGLDQGWDGFVTSVGVVLLVLGAVLPFAVLLALVGLPLWLVWRRRRQGRPVIPPQVPVAEA